MKSSPRVNPVSIKSRIAQLHEKRQALKTRIGEELRRPMPCSVSLRQLKRRRLIIKDQIARYDGLLRTLGAHFERQQSI